MIMIPNYETIGAYLVQSAYKTDYTFMGGQVLELHDDYRDVNHKEFTKKLFEEMEQYFLITQIPAMTEWEAMQAAAGGDIFSIVPRIEQLDKVELADNVKNNFSVYINAGVIVRIKESGEEEADKFYSTYVGAYLNYLKEPKLFQIRAPKLFAMYVQIGAALSTNKHRYFTMAHWKDTIA